MEVELERETEFDDINSVCIICCERISVSDGYATAMHPQFQNPEKLAELFKLFCQYMSWEIGNDLKFNFVKEGFPFCSICKATIISIFRLHQVVQNVIKDINQITTDVMAKFLYSKDKNDHISYICANIANTDGRKHEHLTKVKQMRNFVFSRYSPKVRVKQIVNKFEPGLDEDFEPIEIEPVNANDDSTFLDDCRAPSDSPGYSGDSDGNSCSPVKSNNESESNVKLERIENESTLKVYKPSMKRKLSVFFGEKLFNFQFHAGMYKCGICDVTYQKKLDLLQHAGKEHFMKGKETQRAERPSPSKTQGVPIKVKVKSKIADTINFSPKFKTFVRQISDTKFIFDKEFPFELNSDKKWVCTTCKKTFFSRHTIEHHLLVRSCKKVKSQNINDAVVELLTDEEKSDQESDDDTTSKTIMMYDKFPMTINKRGWKCCTCSEIFSNRDAIKRHVLTLCKGFDAENDRSCVETEQNKFLFGNKYTFEFVDDTYKCGTCDIAIPNRQKMLIHISKVHIENIRRNVNHLVELSQNQFIYANKFYAEKVGDEFRCCSCSFTTKTRHSLTKHLYNKHLGDKKHVCDVCGKGFQMMCQLKAHHMRVHKGDKFYKKMIYVCDICGRLYSNKTEWGWHQQEHEDVNVVGIPCETCGKYVYKHKMKVHLRSHNNKEFECKDCNKSFASKWYLSVHLQTHGGEKPYACPICATRFSQKSSVRKHKIKFHDVCDG